MTANIQDDVEKTYTNFGSITIRHNLTKRLFDICFSIGFLLLTLPLFILLSSFIFLTSPGPIFYGHKRIGRGGKVFKCLKFRTMYIDADIRLKNILESNPDMKKEWDKSRKLKSDPRILKFGGFLRKSSLDELPQFINVLKGDLSVVGPRPVMDDEMKQYFGSKAAKILQIRPGITGIWQTSGRSNTNYETRIALDEQYVDKQNILLDIKLILKTIPCILFSKGAY
jgi:exopolysaccharide production protein ExoY